MRGKNNEVIGYPITSELIDKKIIPGNRFNLKLLHPRNN